MMADEKKQPEQPKAQDPAKKSAAAQPQQTNPKADAKPIRVLESDDRTDDGLGRNLLG
jgi:hypothetical protein